MYVLRVEPVAGPFTNESKGITSVLEAVVIVIALGDTKRVFAAKIGFVTVVGDAAIAATTGALRPLSRLCFHLLLLSVFLFRLTVIVLLLRISLFGFCALLRL